MAHPAFLGGDVMDLSSSFLFRDGSHPLKTKGAKKGGSSFLMQMVHDPLFLKAILDKRGIPHFSFFCGLRLQGMWPKKSKHALQASAAELQEALNLKGGHLKGGRLKMGF